MRRRKQRTIGIIIIVQGDLRELITNRLYFRSIEIIESACVNFMTTYVSAKYLCMTKVISQLFSSIDFVLRIVLTMMMIKNLSHNHKRLTYNTLYNRNLT